MKRVFISDCEGPISKNDNAFEVMAHFVPNGDRIFTITSKYDDVLADVIKRVGHKAGDTLRLVLPFLKAYGVTDDAMRVFSARHLVLIANSRSTLRHIRSITPAYIVSTSYEHYIRALCRAVEFPFRNTYCTKLKLDKHNVTQAEKSQLKKIGKEIAEMPLFEIPPGANSLKDLSQAAQETIQKFEDIFCKKIASMNIGRIYSEVSPVGGSEKAEAVKDVVGRLDVTLENVMYVGDSITDEEAFKLVKENDGLTVSFNGNQYAVNNADIALMSIDSTVTAIIADAFIKFGKRQTLDLVADWNPKTLAASLVNRSLLNWLLKLHPHGLPKVKIITSENRERLARESAEFRKKVRGQAIGRLG